MQSGLNLTFHMLSTLYKINLSTSSQQKRWGHWYSLWNFKKKIDIGYSHSIFYAGQNIYKNIITYFLSVEVYYFAKYMVL